MATIRHDWQASEIADIYNQPLLELVFQAAGVHREHHDPLAVQHCSLLSVKTGGCPENCAYCPQSAHYKTGVDAEKLLSAEETVEAAQKAKSMGASRFCMGAAWREVKDGEEFEQVLGMVSSVRDLGLEVCCTLGMVNEEQARRLKEAGLYAYNHNIDSSEDFYGDIISTRNFSDRLQTLENVREAGLTVCCGGIIGMGESHTDRMQMLRTLANMEQHPESVPINALVAVEGTPLGEQPQVPVWDMVRTIAAARILMPASMVRLSAGRLSMGEAEQALCFMAGANSIFIGEKLLTTPNPTNHADDSLFETLGLHSLARD